MDIVKRRVRDRQCGLTEDGWASLTNIHTVVHTTVYIYDAIDCMGQRGTFCGHRDRVIFEVGKPLRADGRKIAKIELQRNYWVISVEDPPESACM